MDTGSPGHIFIAIMAGVALAAAAGLRAFLPLLVLSLAARAGVVTVSSKFAFLESDVAVVALGAATLIEIAADKIPIVDHGLDAVATLVRPAVGFVAGLALLADLPDAVTVVMALLFAVLSLGTHVEHAKLRAGSTAMTAGFANPVVSFVEDGIATVLSVLAVLVPVLAAALVFVMLYFMFRIMRRFRRRKRAPV